MGRRGTYIHQVPELVGLELGDGSPVDGSPGDGLPGNGPPEDTAAQAYVP